MSRNALIAESKRLRDAHRGSSGHDLYRHHPQLWGLLPGSIAPGIAVPPWPEFLQKLREVLERELPNVPVADIGYGECRPKVGKSRPKNPY